MTIELALHGTPRRRDVLVAQIRAVGSVLRGPATAAAALLGLLTLLFVSRLLGDGEVINFHPEQLLLFGVVGLLLPIGVWRGQERFGAGFMWTLPVDRRKHALARVCAGWLWLMAAVALFCLWLLALALLSGENPLAEETLFLLPAHADWPGVIAFLNPDVRAQDALRTVPWTPEPLLWLAPFTAATGTYLLASALTLGLRHPLRWILGALLGLFVLGAVTEAADMEWLMREPHRVLRQLLIGPYGFDTLLTARTELLKIGMTLSSGENIVIWRGFPDVRQWAIATALWLIAGLAALWAAASRHREHRRI